MGNAGDKILYSSSSLSDAARRLQQVGAALQQERSGLLSTLSELDNGNGGDCRIQGRIHLTTVGASYSAGTIDGFIRDLAQALTAEGSYAKDLAGRLNKISEMFAATERELTGQINSIFTGDEAFNEEGGIVTPDSKYTGVTGTAPSSWFLDGFFGSFGAIGATINAIASGLDGVDGNGAKSTAKAAASWFDFATSRNWGKLLKWTKARRASGVGKGLTAPMVIKKALGLGGKSTAAATASWGSKFVQNLKSGFKGIVKTGKNTVNWGGIIGTVVDLGFSAHGNYQQVQAGEISADRAVVETIAETAVGIGVSVAIGAAVAATLPASAGVAAVAVVTGIVTVGVDAAVGALTGGKGVAEVASEGVGWVWDNTIGRLFD